DGPPRADRSVRGDSWRVGVGVSDIETAGPTSAWQDHPDRDGRGDHRRPAAAHRAAGLGGALPEPSDDHGVVIDEAEVVLRGLGPDCSTANR
ncbi:MAG: hypothetical protein ACRDSK_27180, partial [Actinophytocola sp.]